MQTRESWVLNSRKIGFLPKAEAFPPLLKEPLKTWLMSGSAYWVKLLKCALCGVMFSVHRTAMCPGVSPPELRNRNNALKPCSSKSDQELWVDPFPSRPYHPTIEHLLRGLGFFPAVIVARLQLSSTKTPTHLQKKQIFCICGCLFRQHVLSFSLVGGTRVTFQMSNRKCYFFWWNNSLKCCSSEFHWIFSLICQIVVFL